MNHTLLKSAVLEQAMAYDNPEHRPWLRVCHVDSYQSQSNRVECWAMEGSPLRGFILFLTGQGVAYRYDGYGKRQKTFRMEGA